MSENKVEGAPEKIDSPAALLRATIAFVNVADEFVGDGSPATPVAYGKLMAMARSVLDQLPSRERMLHLLHDLLALAEDDDQELRN